MNPYTQQHETSRFKIPYWVNPAEVQDYTTKKWKELDKSAEVRYVSTLNVQCERERMERDRIVQDAQGFFWTDQIQLDRARNLEMRNCKRLNELGYRSY